MGVTMIKAQNGMTPELREALQSLRAVFQSMTHENPLSTEETTDAQLVQRAASMIRSHEPVDRTAKFFTEHAPLSFEDCEARYAS